MNNFKLKQFNVKKDIYFSFWKYHFISLNSYQDKISMTLLDKVLPEAFAEGINIVWEWIKENRFHIDIEKVLLAIWKKHR